MPIIPIHPDGSYKAYKAHMHQSSTNAPVLDYELNQFGQPIVWTRADTGQYTGTSNEQFINRYKILCFTGQGLGPNWTISLYPDTDDTLALVVSYNGYATDNWQNIYIEIQKMN